MTPQVGAVRKHGPIDRTTLTSGKRSGEKKEKRRGGKGADLSIRLPYEEKREVLFQKEKGRREKANASERKWSTGVEGKNSKGEA